MADEENIGRIPFPPVGEAEAGQKLLRLLSRRLALPESLLHRWLRTGQIRLNGRRSKPFEVVKAGDIIRLPTFANRLNADAAAPDVPSADSGLPPIIDAVDGIWAFAKPAGLAVQGGTGLNENLADMLARVYAGHAFIPAPAHRLDRQTSGVLLIGASFPALRQLQQWFAKGLMQKEYLAWTHGRFPSEGDCLLRHYLEESDKVTAFNAPAPNRHEARCLVRPILHRADCSLLHIRLLTGRKRQLRAQLAAMGTPVAGDSRYGARPGASMLLHSCRIFTPAGHRFELTPSWGGARSVTELPEPFISDQTAPAQAKSDDFVSLQPR